MIIVIKIGHCELACPPLEGFRNYFLYFTTLPAIGMLKYFKIFSSLTTFENKFSLTNFNLKI